MITKSIVWQRLDGGTSITYYDSEDNYDLIIQKHITSVGGTILKVVDGVIKKPASREHRNEWKLNGDKIEVDQAKLDLKLFKESEKLNRRSATLSKLKISEDELKDIIS